MSQLIKITLLFCCGIYRFNDIIQFKLGPIYFSQKKKRIFIWSFDLYYCNIGTPCNSVIHTFVILVHPVSLLESNLYRALTYCAGIVILITSLLWVDGAAKLVLTMRSQYPLDIQSLPHFENINCIPTNKFIKF